MTTITIHVDTVNKQQFEVSCGTIERNTSTGLITATFEWTIGPPELLDLFSPLDALKFLAINLNQATIYSNGTCMKTSGSRFTNLRPPPNISEVDIGSGLRATRTLNENASGSVVFHDILPNSWLIVLTLTLISPCSQVLCFGVLYIYK